MKFFLLLFPFSLLAQSDEMLFLQEVNKVRTNPVEYSKVVKEEAQLVAQKMPSDFMQRVEELVKVLCNTTPMKALVYDSLLRRDLESHKGIREAEMRVDHDLDCSHRYTSSAENIAPSRSYRTAVVLLLIDYGVENLGHRKNILNPEYTHSAVRKITLGKGKFGSMHFWVQQFGHN